MVEDPIVAERVLAAADPYPRVEQPEAHRGEAVVGWRHLSPEQSTDPQLEREEVPVPAHKEEKDRRRVRHGLHGTGPAERL